MTENLNEIVNQENNGTLVKPNPCPYVMAALPSYRQHCDGLMSQHPEHVSAQAVKNFQNANVNKFLSSYGLGMVKGKPIDDKVTERYKRVFDKFTNREYLSDAEITLDSGGFQLQVGYGTKDETDTLIELYHNFIRAEGDKIDYAFTLDLAPGATTCLYDTWGEMESYNHKSYGASAALPDELRKKMLYIHHFRTPKINEIWKRMLFDMGMADNFENFATGGLVSFSNSSQQFPVILYVVPLIHILHYAKERGLKKFRFHVLGASEYKDQIAHEFFRHHIKKIHDIDIEITYDSSTIFKVLAMSRFIYVPDWQHQQLWKMTIREDLLDTNFKNYGKTHSQLFYELTNKACTPYGMQPINPIDDPLYYLDPQGKTCHRNDAPKTVLSRIGYMYGIWHMLGMFKQVHDLGSNLVQELYPIYESGDRVEFDSRIEDCMIGFNNGKISKRISARTVSIANSLDALTELDIDYADHLVERYMGNDECPSLTGNEACTF